MTFEELAAIDPEFRALRDVGIGLELAIKTLEEHELVPVILSQLRIQSELLTRTAALRFYAANAPEEDTEDELPADRPFPCTTKEDLPFVVLR